MSDLDLDPRDPERSAARLIQLADEGWKFHELRRRVAALFADDAVRPPEFAARCLEYVVRARRAGRAADPNARRDPEAPFVADPVAHLFLDALPNASKSMRGPVVDVFETTVRRQRFVARADRLPAAALVLTSMARTLADDARRRTAADENADNAPTKTTAAPRRSNPAAVTRATQTYGLDLADLEDVVVSNPSVGVVSAAATLEAYVDWLFRERRHSPAATLAAHFGLERFASRDVVDALVAEQRFSLASQLVAHRDASHHAGLAESCVATDEHARRSRGPERRRRVWPGGGVSARQTEILRVDHLAHGGQGPVGGGAAIRRGGPEPAPRGDSAPRRERRRGDGERIRRARGYGAAELCDAEELARAAATRRDAHLQLPDGVARAVVFVDDVEGLTRAHVSLRRAKVIGLDTEWAAPLGPRTAAAGSDAADDAETGARRRERATATRASIEDEDEGEESAHAGPVVVRRGCPRGQIPRRIPTTRRNARCRRETIGERGGGAASGGDADGGFLLALPALLARCPEALAT